MTEPEKKKPYVVSDEDEAMIKEYSSLMNDLIDNTHEVCDVFNKKFNTYVEHGRLLVDLYRSNAPLFEQFAKLHDKVTERMKEDPKLFKESILHCKFRRKSWARKDIEQELTKKRARDTDDEEEEEEEEEEYSSEEESD